MKKALGLAIIASLFTAPAFAGETFVRNENSWGDSKTTTNLYIDSETDSYRYETYSSEADKIYVDGDAKISCTLCGGLNAEFDEFSVHKASAELSGSFSETKSTDVYGTTNTVANEYFEAHETSAGVR